MPTSELLTGRILDPLANLWAVSEDLDDYCRRALRILSDALELPGIFLAIREDSVLPWHAVAREPSEEGHLTELLLAQADPAGAPLSDATQTWHPTILSVPRPLGAILFVTQPLGADGAPALQFVAAGIAAQAFGRKAWRADIVVGQVARKLQAIQLLTVNLNNAYDMGELSQNLCTIVAQATGAEAAFLYQRSDGGLKLVEDLAVYAPRQSLRDILAAKPPVTKLETIPLERAGFLAEALKTGRPQVVPDVALLPQVPANMTARGISSLMAAPLLTQREELGVLVVGSCEPRSFTEAEVKTLVDFAQASTGALLT
ncbi:MAG: GAF domain-containing protein, partial [Cyanobacteria bacterium REEB65]|nr:GAF domain-containing protein [Cyanobacteria bacterium REEB65]